MDTGSPSDYIAFYGTLLKQQGVQQALGAAQKLRWVGPCQIPGQLFDLGEYPGLQKGSGVVSGELYEILDPSVLIPLDNYEGCDSANIACSLYVRERVRLISPAVECWVYVYNQPVDGKARIANGIWPPGPK